MLIEEACEKHQVDPERGRAWEAWSNLFLDTELQPEDLSAIAKALAATRFSMAELKAIYKEEVAPACFSNFCAIAGEWAGFDSEWLVAQCKKYYRTESRETPAFNLLQFAFNKVARLSETSDWKAIVERVEHLRNSEGI